MKRKLFVCAAFLCCAAIFHHEVVSGNPLPQHASTAPGTPSGQLEQLANHFVQQVLNHDPTVSYTTGLATTDHSRFADRSPRALAAFDAEEQDDLRALRMIDTRNLPPASRALYANLKEQLESDLQVRVCRQELWNVNHFFGWPSSFAQVAEHQPIESPGDRAQALKRWSSVSRYIDVEVANLKRGLEQGYSAPKSVVRRVIAQMDGMSSGGAEKSPFYSVAQRSSDAAFQTQFSRLIVEQIDPALKRYRDFLQNEYLPKAREGIAVTDLPNGAACYQAFLRQSTTLPRSPQEVFDLGRKTAAATEADILRLGKELFGATDFQAIILAVKGAKGDAEHFKSKEELLEFSRGALARARALTAERLIDRMPKQDVVILPRRDFEDTGPFATYEQEPNTAKPATYRIVLKNWEDQTRGSAERVLVHEAWPGHHLQIALARELVPDTPFSKLLGNAAYQEGWARHAEALAEDAGIYQTKTALILRRVGTGGGMVVDPGLHALHWTRQQAIDYLVATGRFNAKSADDLVDRIAVLPGQATSYDSGGLEIKALRAEAQSKLGARFDLREFNHAVLDEGVVPLTELRTHIESWISAKQAAQ